VYKIYPHKKAGSRIALKMETKQYWIRLYSPTYIRVT